MGSHENNSQADINSLKVIIQSLIILYMLHARIHTLIMSAPFQVNVILTSPLETTPHPVICDRF